MGFQYYRRSNEAKTTYAITSAFHAQFYYYGQVTTWCEWKQSNRITVACDIITNISAGPVWHTVCNFSLRIFLRLCQCKRSLLVIYKLTQSSLNKSTAQISVTAKSTIDLAKQFEFWPIRSSKVQINQPVAFKIQIVQLNLIY